MLVSGDMTCVDGDSDDAFVATSQAGAAQPRINPELTLIDHGRDLGSQSTSALDMVAGTYQRAAPVLPSLEVATLHWPAGIFRVWKGAVSFIRHRPIKAKVESWKQVRPISHCDRGPHDPQVSRRPGNSIIGIGSHCTCPPSYTVASRVCTGSLPDLTAALAITVALLTPVALLGGQGCR